MLALLAVVLAAAPAPPARLACLARYYALAPVQIDGGWAGQLPDGTLLPWNDGRTKSPEERGLAPDLHDLFAEPYPRGAIRPITTVDSDPGRIRVDALFFATYGASAKEIEAKLVPIDFLGERIRVHRKIAPRFLAVARRLAPLVKQNPSLQPFLRKLGGTFNWRHIAGLDKFSAHSFGISLDLNVARSAYWRWAKPAEPVTWRNRLPQAVVDAFEAEGFIWGGRWYHYDTMHFEYRPELVEPDCE